MKLHHVHGASPDRGRGSLPRRRDRVAPRDSGRGALDRAHRLRADAGDDPLVLRSAAAAAAVSSLFPPRRRRLRGAARRPRRRQKLMLMLMLMLMLRASPSPHHRVMPPRAARVPPLVRVTRTKKQSDTHTPE